MKGQIVKILSNDYFVEKDNITYICKARGKLRQKEDSLKVGDYVTFDEKNKIPPAFKADRSNKFRLLSKQKNQQSSPCFQSREEGS